MRRAIREHPKIVSNPVLQREYGGALVPHARLDTGQGHETPRTEIRVVFIGTNRKHKGVEVLRDAVSRVATSGFTLTITDSAPDNARDWETWTGPTSFEGGTQILHDADIAVVPSLAGHAYSAAQLPAKLVDAMMAGRAIVASNLEPIRWALGGTGITVTPGSASELALALEKLADPGLRSQLGTAARQRALSTFTLEAIAPVFRAACLAATH
jgi:glycosyltransferase involved in cell wall biosynthesis